MKQFDVLVLGGGPGGYSFAIAAAKKGLKVALFERERLGGTCLNVGCIPTKYLVDKANAMEKVRDLVRKEIFRGAGSFSFRRIQREKEQVTAKLVGGVQFLLKKSGVTVVSGQAELRPERVVRCGGEEYQGEYVVIATGSAPVRVPIPGCELAIDSTGVLALEHLPQRMVVMGGGIIGLELACAFACYGTQVTVVEMMPALLPREQPEAVEILVSALKKRGIRILTGAKMLRIEKVQSGLRAVCEHEGTETAIEADQVLMAVGRRPCLDGVDAQALGLEMAPKGHILVDGAQRTNLPGVYAIGDVAGGVQLAHAAYAEGEIALTHILTGQIPQNAAPIPSCVYTIPCLASVGLTMQAAKAAGFEPALGSFDYSANGMALAEGASGKVFVVMDKGTERTLGVTIVGENASELIALAALAVDKKLTLAEWERMVVAHPSLAEMVREAALDAFGAAIHKG